jgi:hypothetical protein
MRQQFNNMNKQPGQDGQHSNTSSQGFGAQPGQRPTASERNNSNAGASKIGEYIDFEEVK